MLGTWSYLAGYYDDEGLLPMPFNVRGGLPKESDELAEILLAQASKRFALGVYTGIRAVRAAATTTSRR